jgi:predicted Zn finger-like uncharacterized protein
MAFHVTQCPSCESTFNTNAQVLEAASGQVRCGSCLCVFDALDNFVQTDNAAEQESVFVGSHPEDYFNPSAFLTRRSLQEKSSKLPSPIKPTFADRSALFGNIAKPKPTLEIKPESDTVLLAQTPSAQPSPQLDPKLEEAEAEVTLEREEEADASEQIDSVTDAEIVAKIDTELEVDIENHSPTDTDNSAPDSDAQPSSLSYRDPGYHLENSGRNPEDVTLAVAFSMQPSNEIASAAPDASSDLKPQQELDTNQSDPEQALALLDENLTSEDHTGDEDGNGEGRGDGTSVPTADFAFEPASQLSAEEPSPNTSKDENIELEDIKLEDIELEDSQITETPLQESLNNVTGAFDATQNEFWDSAQELLQIHEEALRDNAALNVSEEINELVTEVITEASSKIETEAQTAVIARSEDADNSHQTDTQQLESDTNVKADPTLKHKEAGFFATVESGFEQEPESLESEFLIEELTPGDDKPRKAEAEAEAENLSTEDIRARALNTKFEDDDALEAIPELNLEAQGKMASPLTLSTAQRLHWRSTLALALACIALSATLIAQYFWWHLPLYSQLDRFRPAYVFVCQYVSCQLPPYSNLDAIRSDDLAVRSHPEQRNALSINMSFRNTASFPQAFPVVILSFNSSANEVIALREFSPQEYLSPGLQSVANMPPNSPVQIQLEIMDPGPFAVNYTLAFRNP